MGFVFLFSLAIKSDTKMECTHPKWILDRRDSGFLFWRRDNDCKRSVKFRCDVEVLEFLPVEEDKEETAQPSALAAAICLTLIAATLSYQWLIY